MKKSGLQISLLFILSFNAVICQVPFHHGVNLSKWFEADSTRQIQFTKFTKQDFINIKSLGCDVIRLPMNLHAMTSGNPDYIIDPMFFSFLDSAATWAEDLHMSLIMDDHSWDPNINTDPSVENILLKVWPQMAQHYKSWSDYIYYELLNEPHGISDSIWGAIEQHVIDTIRTIDTKHTIVVGGENWNSYSSLQYLPVFTDTNLIYTFHFYEPYLFSQQGLPYTTPSLEELTNVPFPYDSARMPPLPDTLKGTSIEGVYDSYNIDGTVASLKQKIDMAINFRDTRHVKIYCGEFGVPIEGPPRQDRLLWYDTVRSYLDANNIPWTFWEYTSDLGIFKLGSYNLFQSDVDTEFIRVLGLNVPEQHPFELKPDTTGFTIYDDYIAQRISQSNWVGGNQIVDYYSQTMPDSGRYCIYWNNADQYYWIGFDFKPNKDLSYLVQNHFALDFMVRGTSPGTVFDVRFIDTKSGPDDHPWRIRYTINDNTVPWDGKWHRVYLPLSKFTEEGSFDSIWYNPQGLFDWSAIDRFEIVAEEQSLTGDSLWFDNIRVIGDTTTVPDTSSTSNDTTSTATVLKKIHSHGVQVKIVPNPVITHAVITYNILKQGYVEISIYSMTGQKVITLVNGQQSPGNYSTEWNCLDMKGIPVVSGIYVCKIILPDKIQSEKIVVQ